MLKLTLSIEKDQTFSGRITEDGVVMAEVNGNAAVLTMTGAVQQFAKVLHQIGCSGWEVKADEGRAKAWDVFYSAAHGNAFVTPGLGCFFGFESEAAARSAAARLKQMWEALPNPPAKLYEVFLTCGEGWGFFDRAGRLHATFKSRVEAQEVADKKP